MFSSFPPRRPRPVEDWEADGKETAGELDAYGARLLRRLARRSRMALAVGEDCAGVATRVAAQPRRPWVPLGSYASTVVSIYCISQQEAAHSTRGRRRARRGGRSSASDPWLNDEGRRVQEGRVLMNLALLWGRSDQDSTLGRRGDVVGELASWGSAVDWVGGHGWVSRCSCSRIGRGGCGG